VHVSQGWYETHCALFAKSICLEKTFQK